MAFRALPVRVLAIHRGVAERRLWRWLTGYEKPVIVSDLDGLTEFVSDGCSGLVFRTEEELAAELDEIAEPGVVEGTWGWR